MNAVTEFLEPGGIFAVYTSCFFMMLGRLCGHKGGCTHPSWPSVVVAAWL